MWASPRSLMRCARPGRGSTTSPHRPPEPNLVVIPVPDPRLETLARISGQTRVAPATIEFVDIAGLVRGASKGEGLGNQFLSHVRGTDGLIEVVRCFSNPQGTHVEGS